MGYFSGVLSRLGIVAGIIMWLVIGGSGDLFLGYWSDGIVELVICLLVFMAPVLAIKWIFDMPSSRPYEKTPEPPRIEPSDDGLPTYRRDPWGRVEPR